MAEFLRTPGTALPGESGDKRAVVAFSHESLCAGWRKLWREWLWEARYRRVTVYIRAGGYWFELGYLDGQGIQYPKVWGDQSLDMKGQLKAQGLIVVDAIISQRDLAKAQRWFLPMSNLKFAKMVLGVPRSARLEPPRPPALPNLSGRKLLWPVRLLAFSLSCLRWTWDLANRGRIRRPAQLALYLEEQHRQRIGRSVAAGAPPDQARFMQEQPS